MTTNPLFTDISTQKLLSLTNYSANILQIYLRLEPKPLALLNTTLPVYQTEKLGDKMNHFKIFHT